MIYLCIYSPVFWVRFGLVYSLLPVFPALPCLAFIKDYYLSLHPRLLVPVSSLLCAPWQKTRPNCKRRPFTSFLFSVFEKCFFICSWVFVSRGKQVRWPRALMPADRGRYSPLAVAIPSPPAGSLVPGLPLPQARLWLNARLWLDARRPASDSMPAGSPLTHARRPLLILAPWIQSTSRPGVPCHVPRVMVF